MEKQGKNKISLKKILNIVVIIGAFLGFSGILIAVLSVVAHFVIKNDDLMNILLYVTAIVFVIFIVYTFAMGYYLYFKLLKDAVDTTSSNVEKFKRLDKDYDKYKYDNIKEFSELNYGLTELSKLNSNIAVINSNFDYSNLNLEYSDNKQIISYESLVENVQNLISITPAFRNAFIEFEYKINELTLDQKNFIVDQILAFFDNPHILVAFNLSKKRIVIYNPNIDSISMLKEKVINLMKKCVVYEHVGKDEKLICPMASIVVYPYSKIDDIFSDLNYARRKNQPLNLYLPRRLIKGNDKVFSTAMNINNVSKIIEGFSDFSNVDSMEEVRRKFEYHFKRISSFYNFDFAGLVIYDDFFGYFKPYINISQKQNEVLFNANSVFSTKSVADLAEVIDRDGSFFFSSRNQASAKISSYLDDININSGLFSLIKFNEKIVEITYFLNRNKDLKLDSYLRESLVVFARMISDSICILNYKRNAKEYKDNKQALLRLTDMKIYKVNKIDYKLLDVSDTLKDIYQKPFEGQKCYEYLYGTNTPCENCPFKTGSRRESILDGIKHYSSLLIDKDNSNDCRILMSPVDTGSISPRRFNTDFLINSYYSFIARLNNVFNSQSKGYIIFIKVNNYTDIIEKYGDEKYIKYVRLFLQKVADLDKGIANTYVYCNNVFGVVANECGQVDVLEKCENIFDLSQVNYLNKNDKDNLLSISFITFRYPMNFAAPSDLIKEVELFFKKNISKVQDGYIYFAENDYTRSADRTKFMLDLLDEATSTRNLQVKLLPIIKSNNIIGAELLLRLKDDSKNVLVNTNELINVAIKNNRIGIITDILIDNIGEYYKTYGFSLFRISGFRLFTINTDNSFFADSKFLTSLEYLVQHHHLQKGFLNLEVTEKELSEHYEEMMTTIKILNKLDIYVICDMYIGEYLSLEKLKSLGINKVKIARSLVSKIDVEESNYKELISLIDSCKSYGIMPCVVGVEKEQQVKMITEKYPDILMQGYYFYEPLDADVLFDILKKVNFD